MPSAQLWQDVGDLKNVVLYDILLKREVEMEKSIYILFNIEYTVVNDEERAFIHLKSLSPESINQKLKFRIMGKEEHYSFDQLREVVSKSYFKRGDMLNLFVVNQETGEEQNFGIKISKDWPKDLAANKITARQASHEITSYLENIGIL